MSPGWCLYSVMRMNVNISVSAQHSLVFFRPEPLLTELKACWHMKLHHYTIYYSKSQLPLNTSLEPRWSYIIWWRAANPGFSFIHHLNWLASRDILELSSVDHQDKTLSGKPSQRSIQNHYSIKLSSFHQVDKPHSLIMSQSDPVFDSGINFSILLKQNTRRLMASKIV